ncbi:MAG: hypothetical protein JWM73_52 [Solirubrobacterales bacterium]|nr:hypothetical protein [Solirubrobacterales bacterium]
MRRSLALALILGAFAPAAATAGGWSDAVARARVYAQDRAGSVAFAVIDGKGRKLGYRQFAGWYSASLLKPVILGTYLNRASVRDRGLTLDEERLMEPMIRASADGPASTLFVRLTPARIQRFGRRHGLRSIRVASPIWGSTHITAAGYARFIRELPDDIAPRHRVFARRLLRTIIPSQRWGIAPVKPRGWTLLFKGGWRAGRGYGRIVNQAARLECGPRVISLTILTDRDPSHEYGTQTVEGVARRLLRPLRPCGAAQ